MNGKIKSGALCFTTTYLNFIYIQGSTVPRANHVVFIWSPAEVGVARSPASYPTGQQLKSIFF